MQIRTVVIVKANYIYPKINIDYWIKLKFVFSFKKILLHADFHYAIAVYK